MAWAVDLVDLSCGALRVRSLQPSDFAAVAEAIIDPEGWAGRIWGIDTREKIFAMLEAQMAARERGECNPFVYLVEGEIAGITRYLHFAPQRRGLEIGGTCVARRWQRTFVNTWVKSLLLAHAFEALGAVRAEFRVDCQNYRSQLAVLRLGAVFEGKIRSWQMRKDGTVPDGMLYSITEREWPRVKERLSALRDGLPPKEDFLPRELETPRLRLALYRLADAPDLLALAWNNREQLVDSFPQAGNLHTLSEAEAAIARRAHEAAAGTAFYYAVWDKATGRQVGQLQIKQIDWNFRGAELGYFLDRSLHRRGLGTELVAAALHELEDKRGFHRVIIRALPHNLASTALALKLGFAPEGIQRSSFVTGRGLRADLAVYSRTSLLPALRIASE
jgi:N-acetyltransferase